MPQFQAVHWRDELKPLAATWIAVLLLSAISSRFFLADASVSVLRPAQGLLLGMLLLRHATWGRAAVWLGLGYLAMCLGNVWAGRPLPLAAGLSLARSVEIGLGFGVLRMLRKDLVGLPDLDSVLWLMAVSLVVPVLGGAMAAVVTDRFIGGGLLHTWFDWWVGSSFGLLMVLPLVLAWPRGNAVPAIMERTHAAALAALTMLVTLGSVLWLAHPFVVMALALLLVAFRAGVFATAMAGLLQAAIVLTIFRLQPSALPVLPPARGLAGLGLAEVVLGSLLVTIPPLVVAVLEQQRRRSMQALKSVREQLALITDNVPALIAEIGTDLRYRFVNRKYGEWFGKQAEDMLGRTPAEVFGENTGRRLLTRMQRVLAGMPQRFEITMDNGQDLEARYEPQFGPQGEINGFLVLAQDVSWRKRNERRFQQLLESAPDAILVVDGRRCIELVNAQAERTFGFGREELLGQPLVRLIPQFADIGDDAVRMHLQHDSPMRAQGVGLELTGVRRDGAFPLELILGELDNEGAPLLLASVRDITERRQAERALHESRERAQITLNSIGDAVVACDTSLRITDFNPVAVSMTGWQASEAIGKHLHEVVKLVDPASGQAPLSPLEIAIRDQRIVGLQADTLLENRDGARSPIEDSAAPILDREGRVVGGIMVFHDVSESRAMAIKMSHLAQHDYLTDLPNRVLLHDRLAQALALIDRGAKGALMFVDLDHFKVINDTLGHHAGDEVLQEVSRRLAEAVRDDDTVSRQGGDEFVLLLVRLADPRDAARVAEKLINAIEQPFHVQGETLHISASVGIALFPQDGRDIKTLMKQADTALYHAKQSGRGRYSYFTEIMSEHAEVRMRMEHDLRLALANESFLLVYQPMVSLPGNTIVGMEALVRWRDPDGNAVPPDRFIPVAEETGLIGKLDAWVMREACRQNQEWQDAGFRRIPVSVNVSLARFDPDQLVATVHEALDATGLAPEYLEIEFTESQMFQHQDRTRDLIDKLKEIGVQVGVDDFGTGYSSLSYLVNYKFDTLKIDRSFVKGLPEDAKQHAVVQAIIGMSHALDYKIVAEGVESHAQAETLLRHGCNTMQGYLYSRPVPPEEFVRLLQRGHIVLPDIGIGQRPLSA